MALLEDIQPLQICIIYMLRLSTHRALSDARFLIGYPPGVIATDVAAVSDIPPPQRPQYSNQQALMMTIRIRAE